MGISKKDAYSIMLKNYPDVMDATQVCEVLGVSTKTGYALFRSGKIDCLKVGRPYRIPKVNLLEYLKVGRAGMPSIEPNIVTKS